MSGTRLAPGCSSEIPALTVDLLPSRMKTSGERGDGSWGRFDSRPVRVGLVGTSWWSALAFAPALAAHPRAELAAVCGRDFERTRAFADEHGIGAVFHDPNELIAAPGLDAVVVAVPDDLHHRVALAAIDRGLHVLCEKPLAFTEAQARDMRDRAVAAGIVHMVMFTYRWMPYYRYVLELLREGFVGECHHADFRFLMGHGRKPEYAWRFDATRANGVLGDLGVHLIDLARWLVGDVRGVASSLGVVVQRPGADGGRLEPANDSASLLLDFVGGASGSLNASAVSHLGDRAFVQEVRLYGSEGSLEVDVVLGGDGAGSTVLRGARGSGGALELLHVPDSYWGGVDPAAPFMVLGVHSAGARAFVDAVLGVGPASPDFEDGYLAQRVVAAALEAQANGRWVRL
jgi:predicted dehydrogenase